MIAGLPMVNVPTYFRDICICTTQDLFVHLGHIESGKKEPLFPLATTKRFPHGVTV